MESEYFYQEVTRPALRLLRTEGFDGPLRDFLDAHEHFRQGRFDAAILKASNSLESTIKTIFGKRKITYDKKLTANQLIEKLIKETDLIPKYFESYFNNLTNVLQGLPTIRNKDVAHGKEGHPVDVPQYLAEYAVNSAAANILFLVSAHKSNAGD